MRVPTVLDDDSLRAIGRVAVASGAVDVSAVDMILEMSVRLGIEPLPQPGELIQRSSGRLRKKLDYLNSLYEQRFSADDPKFAEDVKDWLKVSKVHHEARGQLIHAQWLFQGADDAPRAMGIYSGGDHGLELIPRDPRKFDLLADRLTAIASDGSKLLRRIQDARRAADGGSGDR